METIVVMLIVAAATAYLIKSFKKSSKKGQGNGCGCSSCPPSGQCEDPGKN